jgi:hypothetical protein
MSIEHLLKNKSSEERANAKGLEISKIKTLEKTKRGNLHIQITDTRKVEKGVEIFARVWENGKQIGFGKDGSVDIERFVFINPPILVDDPNGTIEREMKDDDGVVIKVRKLKEDPKEAILQALEHTMVVKKQKSDDSNIIEGKIGNTTLTAYPNPGTGTAPVDAATTGNVASTAFSTIRGAAGDSADNTGTTNECIRLKATTTTDEYDKFNRALFGFDTSSIGTDGIDSASFSLYGFGSADNLSQSVVIDRNVPASGSAIVASDHNLANWDGAEQATGRIAVSAWSTIAYNDFTLGATGEGNINKSGDSWYGTRGSSDFDNSAPTWSSAVDATARPYFSDETGTSKDPKLVVEHSAATLANVKSMDGLAKASMKSVDGLAIASIKSINGVI